MRSLLRIQAWYLVHTAWSKPKWYSNETFHLAHLMRCLFGTLGVPWLITTTSPKRNWQRLNFFPAGKPNWFTFEIGTSLPRWRSGLSGSSCSVNSSGKLPSIWGWSHHMLWGNLSRDALFTNCPFLQIAFLRCLLRVAFLRYASLRDAFLRVGSFRDASLRYAFLRVTSLRCASLCVAF